MKVTKTRLLKIIHKHCLQCVCGVRKEIELCPDTECLLRPYRMGRVKEEKRLGKVVDLIENKAVTTA